MPTARAILQRRLAPRAPGWLDIRTGLRHFALITYALPAERLRPLVHPRFEIETFHIEGQERALLSVVPFEDAGFHFRFLPWPRFRFHQTNYRIYVRDRVTGERVVWFLGTTLGSWTVHVCRALWGIPWHPARYRSGNEWDAQAQRYRRYRIHVRSQWAPATIELRDTGEPIGLVPGFEDEDEMMLCLTHPVEGYFWRLNGTLGTYSVAHDILDLRRAEPVELHFGLLERLGILDAEEMRAPHSTWICPETVFDIHMPPVGVPESPGD
ncbi:MAG: DUF2071 domain-containing protein [Planctomycetes bacterium]|nr:DUF2071 domain-containing protein [Planctomycetota bacterium]